MQYLFEKKNGDRVALTQEQYNDLSLMDDISLTHLVRTKTLTIVCLGKPRKFHERPPNYGGGKRQRNPYDHINSKGMGLSNWQVENF